MAISTAVLASAVARVVGIQTTYRDFRAGNVINLPQRIAIVGQGATSAVYSTTKRQITSEFEAGTLFGFGSPVHLAARQLLPANGSGAAGIPVTVYPLADDGSGVAAVGSVAPTGAVTAAGAYRLRIGGVLSQEFVVSVGDAVGDIVAAMIAAVNAVLHMPVIATDGTTEVTLTSKWKGASANGITVEVVGDAVTGVTFATTQPTGGLVNPDVDPALAQVGNVWETLILNCLDVADTTTLDKYQTFGEGRWGALVRKPLVVFSGTTEADIATAVAVPDARKDDRVNAQLVAPGSADLPFVVAARQLAQIAVSADNNPARDFGSLAASGLLPGTDGEQWTYPQRDQAVKAGSSTVEVRDGVVTISDVVTFYHPEGDPVPAYRYVCDIIKLQNIIFNLDLQFATPEWDGAPLIPDDQPTVNPDARTPKAARAAAGLVTDSLGLNAILSDPAFTKANTVAEVNASNPKRLDMRVPVKLAGNVNILSVDLDFGFFFGGGTLAA